MPRRVFYSFHFGADCTRTQLVRNMGAIEGSSVATPNRWEEIKRSGDAAIKSWIDANMKGKSAVVVLIGSETADRRWVKYEIKKAWNDGRALLGIHIHGLKDLNGRTATKGRNPFGNFTIGAAGTPMSSLVPVYDPTRTSSKFTYQNIALHLPLWIDDAIENRRRAA